MPKCLQVEIEHRFFFFALVGVFLAQRNHLAQDFRIKAIALRLSVDFLDVGGDGLLLFLKALDALDNAFQLSLGKTGFVIHVWSLQKI